MNPIFSPSRFYETYPELANPAYQEALPYHSFSCNDVIYLRSEVERLTGTCKALDEENLKLKTCSTQDQTLLADNERLLHELTVLRDSKALDKDSILINDLTEDNRRLSYELSETMKDSEEWRSKYLVLEKRLSEVLTKETHYIADLEGLNAVLGDRDRTIRDLRAKINAQFDLVRMNEGLRREEEVLRATIRERDHTIELMRRDQDVQIGWLQQENNRLKRIIDEMNSDYETLKMRSKEGSESHHIANELQIKVTSLNNEITELKRIIMGKDIEMEHLRTKVNDLVVVEKELKSSLKEKSPEHLALEDRFDELLNESEKLKSSLAGKTKECEGLKTKIAQYIESDMIATASLKEKTTLLEGVEAKLKALEKENNAQKGLASEKTKECDLLKVKLTRVENDWEKALKEKTDFGNELQKMEKEFARQKKKKAELKAKVKEIDLMENKMRQMSMEKERLLQTIADKNTEIKKIEMKVQRLESEVAQVIELRARITNLTDENKTWKSKMSEKDEKIKVLTAEIAQMKEKMTVIKKEKKEMLTEKEKLNTTISEKTREIALLRSEATKVGMLSEKLLSLESEKEKLMSLLERKKKEFVRESEMNRILIEELKTQLASLQLKNNTNTNWRDEIAKLIEENAKLKARCALLEKDSLLINDLKLRLARE